MDALSALQEAVRTTPIPGSPPPLSRGIASAGLSFLDIALRQNHVRRLTERLQVIEHGTARRRTEVDINLGLLEDGQVAGLQLHDRVRGPARPQPSPETTLWVPVTRIAERSVAPIDVYDEGGVKLPRLTQYETSRFLASGLYQLLRGILTSRQDARTESDLARLLFEVDEARWLLQNAFLRLLLERSKPDAPARIERTEGMEPAQAADVRRLTSEVLTNVRDDLEQYLSLLDIALNDYLLVVALSTTDPEHLLSYDSPLHGGARRPSRPDPLRWARGRAATYTVTYTSLVPSTLPAYHLVVETEKTVQIDSLVLTTNCDQAETYALARDLDSLAPHVVTRSGDLTPAEKVVDLEAQTAVRALGELLRRRRWDAQEARLDLRTDLIPACQTLASVALAGERLPHASNGRPKEDHDGVSAMIRHPRVTPTVLRDAAVELDRFELAHDLSLEDDPDGALAHVYWRRPPGHHPPAQRMRIVARAAMSDASHSRPYSIINYAGALAGIIYAIGLFVAGPAWPLRQGATLDVGLNNNDAVVAVLVLIPGFLYTRLDLPLRHSVAAKVHTVPRVIAHTCVGVMALLAASVAVGVDGRTERALFLAALVVQLVFVLVLVRQRRALTFAEHMAEAAPRWCTPTGEPVRRRAPDAAYRSSTEAADAE